MGGCCFTAKRLENTVDDESIMGEDFPVAKAVEDEPLVAQVVQATGPQDPEEFYAQFNYTFLEGHSAEDKALAARKESPDDRILDLLLIMDCTSSMSSWIELCKRTLKDCIDDLNQEHEELQVRVAFLGYRDFGDKDNIFVIQDFSFDLEGVKNLISNTVARGGQDLPEDVQGGLYQGLKLSWREVSVKICYVCTDAPCHGKAYHSLRDHYPEGNPAGLYIEDLMEEYSNKDIDLTVYELTAQTKNMYDIMEQAYNQGSNSGQLKRIKLEKEIKLAATNNESLTLKGGLMETAYRTNMNKDLRSRAQFQYAKHGWSSNAGPSSMKKNRKKKF